MTLLLIALLAVAVLLLTAVPGYLLKKKNMLGEDCISGFSKVLIYVCQPCLAIYTFMELPRSWENIANVGIFAALVLLVQIIMLGTAFLVLRKKSREPIYRIITLATTFANCGFFGIPIIEALLPDIASELIVYTTVYSIIMNIIGWTVGSAIISHDTKYISVNKILINPSVISIAAALIIYGIGIGFPDTVYNMIVATARMATPLSMLIMGMRLGTMSLPHLFVDIRVYLTAAVKHLAMPLLTFAILFAFQGVDVNLRKTLFILTACPVASVVLNYAEILGEGQKEAANMVLLSTMLSILTLPIMMLLLPFIN